MMTDAKVRERASVLAARMDGAGTEAVSNRSATMQQHGIVRAGNVKATARAYGIPAAHLRRAIKEHALRPASQFWLATVYDMKIKAFFASPDRVSIHRRKSPTK
jgi:hypothetical protein